MIFGLPFSVPPQIQVIRPAPAPGPLDNPLKGWCTYPDAGPINQPYSMIFLYVPWKELEPTRGHYAFDAWERRAWNTPTTRGKRIVFRVYIDYPTRPSGLPDWLRQEGVKVTRYKEQGGGESPDYDDLKMVAAMLRLIAALGKRYNVNPRIAFVQFGLLGFWGEWHTYPRTELFASDRTVAKVLDAAHRAFPDKKVMNRYPSGYGGRQRWLGFFDDYFPEDTDGKENWQFLPRLRASGRGDAWKEVPFGGEMVPGAAKRLLGDGFTTMMKRAEDAHFSWVGPYSPAMAGIVEPDLLARSQAMVRRLGYEYRLDEIRLHGAPRRGSPLAIEVRGTNQGIAPFYYPWPVELALQDAKGRIAQRWGVKTDLRTWLPGSFRFRSDSRIAVRPGSYRLMLGIRDPWTGEAGNWVCERSASEGWMDATRGGPRPMTTRLRRDLVGYAFVSPWLLGFLLFTLWPFLRSLYLSFTRYDVVRPPRWVGLANYRSLLTDDETFWNAAWITLKFAIVSVPLGILAGVVLALLLNANIRGIAVYRTVFFLPSIVPTVATTAIFMWILNPQIGLVNGLLDKVGIVGPAWLTDPKWAFWSLVFMGLWGVGNSMIIYLAGLKDIPSYLYEAAIVDGASAWKRLTRITLPMLTPVIFFNLVMGVIGALQYFTQAYIMTSGGPEDSTRFYALYLFDRAWRYADMGYASAMAWLLFLAIAVLTGFLFRTQKRWVHYGG